MDLGVGELLVIVAVILVLFGSKKLPDTARALGRSLRIFKAETRGLHDDEPVGHRQAPPPQPRRLPPGRKVGVDGVPVSQAQPAAAAPDPKSC